MTDEDEQVQLIRAQRAGLITTVAFFVAGLSIVLSLDLSGPFFGLPHFRQGGLFILVGGLVLAVVLYFVLQRVIPTSRPCSQCHLPVPLGASACPSCGQEVSTPEVRTRNR